MLKRFGFRVRVGADEHTTISYSVEDEMLRLDRTHSGEVTFHDSFAAVHSAKLIADQ